MLLKDFMKKLKKNKFKLLLKIQMKKKNNKLLKKKIIYKYLIKLIHLKFIFLIQNIFKSKII